MTRALLLAWAFTALASCGGPTDSAPKSDVYERIVTFAPHLTELVFAVGAEEQLVGISAWSDYPPAALSLPVVGDAFSIDQEQLALLNPDLLLVWQSGTPAHVIDELETTGYTVESVRTRGLADVSAAMLRIGELTGRSAGARAAVAAFDSELQALRDSSKGRTPIRVFYQVSARPLYTVNREHYVSELIEICGGTNVFDDLTELAPAVSVEAVVDRNPEVMLTSTDAGDDGFTEWQRWPDIAANLYGNLFLLPADEIARATPRLVIAGRAVCLALRKARFNRDTISGAGQ